MTSEHATRRSVSTRRAHHPAVRRARSQSVSVRARACAQVGGDNLDFAVAHLLRPGAAVGHVRSRGSVDDSNKRHKEAAQAGTGPRFTEILAHVSTRAHARARASRN